MRLRRRLELVRAEPMQYFEKPCGWMRRSQSRTLLTCGDVIEAQVGIDGKTFGLGLVYQCDTVETVLDLFGETLRGIMKIGTQELVVVDEILILTMELNIVLRMEGVELFHSDTLLLRAAVVILRLHLQETQSGTDV